MAEKKKILFVNEAHWISTGYATYGKEVLPRLFDSGKYELAELAIYGQTGDPRGNAPWKVYGNQPSKPDPAYDQYANQNGEYTFDKVCLDFKPDFVCLPPGELILTDKGYRPIELISEGDKVMTHRGRYRKVNRTMKRLYNDDLMVIKTLDSDLEKRTTTEHPYLSSSNIYEDAKFIPASDLKLDNYLFLKTTTKFKSQALSYKLPISISQERIVKLNESYYELMGYIVGCGLFIRNGLFVVFRKERVDLVNRVATLFHEVFGIGGTVSSFKRGAYISFSNHSSLLIKHLKALVNVRTTNRRCPPAIWRASNDNKIIFLSAIRKGLECSELFVSRRNYKISQEIRNLYLQCGYACAVRKKGLSLWTVVLEDNNVKFLENHCYTRISSIRREHYEGYVYNLEVEDDNTYVYQDVIVHNCDIRDPWVYDFEERSPARPFFNWVVMPTADSEPFDDAFVSTLKSADSVLSYSEYGYNLMSKEGGGRLKLDGVAPPCAEEFMRHVVNKPGHKTIYGIPSDSFVIGTVMRNQRRKLFPELLDSFRILLNKSNDKERKRLYLYFHTAWPDLGWDIPKILKEYGLGHKVLFTYYCDNCKLLQPSLYQDVRSTCRKCNQFTSVMPNTGKGLDRMDLARVYNFFDLYVQYANSEGFGLSQVEAAYCGIPILSTDYSAMADVSRNVGGFPIPVHRYYREPEGHTFKALPDNEWTANKILELMRMENLNKLGSDHARLSREVYNWDKTTNVWMSVFDKLPKKGLWELPPKNLKMNFGALNDNMSDAEFVQKALEYVANRPDMSSTLFSANILTWLMTGTILLDGREDGKIVRKEAPFNRQGVLNICVDLFNKREQFEKQRLIHSGK